MERRNYLFTGNKRGSKTAAIFMNLITICKDHKINFCEYLKDVLARINFHSHSKLQEFLPHNWERPHNRK